MQKVYVNNEYDSGATIEGNTVTLSYYPIGPIFIEIRDGLPTLAEYMNATAEIGE